MHLRDIRDPPRTLLHRPCGDVLARQENLSCHQWQQSEDGLKERCLADTVRTEETERLPARDGERDVLKNRLFPIAAGHGLQFE